VKRTFSAAIEIESSSREEFHWQLLVATLVLSATAGFIIMITAMPAPAMLRHRRFSRINSYPSPWRPTAEEFGQAFGFADFAG